MADDTPIDGKGTSEGTPADGAEDSAFDNLPPLSDFESADGGDSGFDSNLPPLGNLDSDSADASSESSGGLPPISDIPIETPVPTGGAVKPPPVGFEEGTALDTPTSSDGLATPVGDESSAFQSLAADSDFTPETPEVAPPGPDSDMETPMFDSAFGGDSGEFSGAVDTSAPTQAMATPMFGSEAGAPPGAPAFAEAPSDSPEFAAAADDDFSFDGDATFGAPEPGTPSPDFAATPGPVAAAPVAAPAPPGGGARTPVPTTGSSSSKSFLVAACVGLVCLLVGLFVGGAVLYKVPAIPGLKPWEADIEGLNTQLTTQKSAAAGLRTKADNAQAKVDKLTKQLEDMLTDGDEPITPEQIAGLKADFDKYMAQVPILEAEIEEKTAAYVALKDDHEALQNNVAIAQSWERGLAIEVERLQGMVGTLEEFNARRIVNKETFESDVAQLAIQIREGNALVPEAYSRSARVAAADLLLDRARDANWVSPELLDEYTNLYLTELSIANDREYFFAKIPVQDRFGTKSVRWAECLMNGNWSTYYRTVDGEHVGIYQPAKDMQPPQFNFVVDLSEAVRLQIEEEISAAAKQTPGSGERINVLLKKQATFDDTSRIPMSQVSSTEQWWRSYVQPVMDSL